MSIADSTPLDTAALRQAIADLDQIVQAGAYRDYAAELALAQREQRRREQGRTLGEELYASDLAEYLGRLLGIDRHALEPLAWEHVFGGRRGAVLSELRDFAERLGQPTAHDRTKPTDPASDHHPAIARAQRKAIENAPRRRRVSA